MTLADKIVLLACRRGHGEYGDWRQVGARLSYITGREAAVVRVLSLARMNFLPPRVVLGSAESVSIVLDGTQRATAGSRNGEALRADQAVTLGISVPSISNRPQAAA